MKIIKALLTRVNIMVSLLLLQVILFSVALYSFLHYFPIITAFSYVISISIVLLLVKKEKPSAYKIVWIITIMAFPVSGGLLYLFFGDKRPLKRMYKRTSKEHGLIAKHLQQNNDALEYIKLQNDRMVGCAQYVRRVSAYPAYQDTDVRYYSLGESMFEEMLTELANAKKFIFLEYFIISKSYMWKSILNILIQKAKEGVDVRLIYDDIGSLKLFTSAYVRKLRNANIKTIAFNPFVPFLSLVMNNRDHRKILVVDGNTAFNGGMNIGDEYINRTNPYGKWKDTGVRLKGDAVYSFTLMFIETWNASCKPYQRIHNYESYKNTAKEPLMNYGFVQPFSDTPLDSEQVGENIYIELLTQAKEYVYIFTPYLIISDKMIFALQMAAKRGVDVRIATPGIPDKKIIYRVTRSFYKCLLGAGIRIYEYTPGFLHAKNFVCDDKMAVVGTINLDYRSLYLHFECATLLYNTSCIKEIKEDAISTMKEGREITPKDCARGFWNELIDAILHLFAPLL